MVYSATIPEGLITWADDNIGLLGAPVQVFQINRFLDGKTIKLFVTGPSMTLVTSDPYAVRYAIETLFEDAQFSDDWPQLSDLYEKPEPGDIN